MSDATPSRWFKRLLAGRAMSRLASVAARRPAHGRNLAEKVRGIAPKSDFPAIVIGSGIGGLTAAAYLARSGFRVTVLEKNDAPGGYATSFRRGRFVFDVSLHASCMGDTPSRRVLDELGAAEHVHFEPLGQLFRIKTPRHDITLPAGDPDSFVRTLAASFPSQAGGIRSLVDDFVGIADEGDRFQRRDGRFVRVLFPFQYPRLWDVRHTTMEEMLDRRITDRELRSVLAASWQYFGLPPSRMSAFYYAMGMGEFLSKGAHYPRERSQGITAALVRVIEKEGGEVICGRKVERILVERGEAVGVVDTDGREHRARAVISNASGPATLGGMLPGGSLPPRYEEALRTYRPSLSSFVVWLGLDRDVTPVVPQAETFLVASHDTELDYAAALNVDVEEVPLAVTVHDNTISDNSDEGATALSIMFVCGYPYWKRFEEDYLRSRKDAYIAEKDRIATAIVRRVERDLVPGLSDMIEEIDAATPLTNLRYTGNTEGAIYGFEQSVANSYMNRIENRTPVRFLYLSSAWGMPGGGISGVLRAGQQTFRCLVEDWARA